MLRWNFGAGTMKQVFGSIAIAVSALMAPPAVAHAAPVAPFDAVSVIETWLLPRYDTLVASTGAQLAAWTSFCAKPDADGIAGLKASFGTAADSWSAVEFVTMGPVSLSLRADRFNFFPDRRNSISRGMAELISDPDPARLTIERIAQA
ncbi:MAG: hypothetical protein B7Z45_08585, partial [Azorhizobium sp. 12-66-6]